MCSVHCTNFLLLLGEIKDVYDDAQTTLGTLEVEMKEQGQEMKKWVSTKAQANSTTQISVLSVAHPHAILDDLSYKLCKHTHTHAHTHDTHTHTLTHIHKDKDK